MEGICPQDSLQDPELTSTNNLQTGIERCSLHQYTRCDRTFPSGVAYGIKMQLRLV